jgi:hypothetical protein
MAEKQFSWITEATLDTTEVIPKTDKHVPELSSLKERMLTHKKALIFIGTLLLILFILKLTQKEKVIAPSQLEAMMAVLPIPKGQVVEGMLLRPVRIAPSQLSKSQKLLVLRPDDAEKIMGKVRAKKDIPSQKPIFWNELELVPEIKVPKKLIVPTVTYPEN